VCLELSVSYDKRDITEGGSLKERTQFITESTAWNLDWSDTGLTSNVDRLTNHTHLHTDRQHTHHLNRLLIDRVVTNVEKHIENVYKRWY